MRSYRHFSISLVWILASLLGASGCSSSDTPPSRDQSAGAGGDVTGGTGGSDGTAGMSSDSGASVGSDASTGGPDTPESVCRDAVTAQCQRRADCGMNTTLQCFGFPNLCPEYYFGPGSPRTVESIRACLPAIRQLSCSDLAVNALPSCLVGGERTMGMGCAYGSQCASTSCEGGSQQCGKCSALAQIGDSCGAAQCAPGAFCHPITMKCESLASIVHGAEGAKCNDQASPVLGCAFDLICMAAPGATEATCQHFISEGQPCPGLGALPCATGHVCVRNAQTGGGNCLSIASCSTTPCDANSYCQYNTTQIACAPRATEGQTCMMTNDTGVIPCVSGTTCTPTSGGPLGVCLKTGSARSLGCSEAGTCPYPLQCLGGRCGPLDPTTCN